MQKEFTACFGRAKIAQITVIVTENQGLWEVSLMREEKGNMAFEERKRWVFFGLPFTFTKYLVGEEIVTVDSGFFKKVENDCYMYKIQDVELTKTLGERIFGLGTVICYTGDTTHPKLYLEHIKHAREVKNYILETSEKMRMRRRTLNTLNIGAESDDLSDADTE